MLGHNEIRPFRRAAGVASGRPRKLCRTGTRGEVVDAASQLASAQTRRYGAPDCRDANRHSFALGGGRCWSVLIREGSHFADGRHPYRQGGNTRFDYCDTVLTRPHEPSEFSL
jgi:hypothetical protein